MNIILHIILLTFFIHSFNSHAQQSVFVKKWDKRFGGNKHDFLNIVVQTNDGGFLLGGQSFSDNIGDKTQPTWGGGDFWIVKIDSIGMKQWDKRYGGAGSDYLSVIIQTKDNGYILGGTSTSGVGGDKTQISWGGSDYWILKIDSMGIKVWDKRYGGILNENLYALQQTKDGGYILGGYSNSGISGDRTEDNWDTTYFYDDSWIIKIDSIGNVMWDKRYGGINQDGVSTLLQTDENGYLLACYSASNISGDKSVNNWGYSDFWIIKIDSLGTIMWDKNYGGIEGEYSPLLIKSSDNYYLLAGFSNSGISGEKTMMGNDWVLKIDTLGYKIWDRAFTGGNIRVNSICPTLDNGFLLSCRSSLPVGGDKSENNLGDMQTWIIKTDSLGYKIWDKTIFTPGYDGYGYAIQSKDGCYIVASSTNGDAGGYVTESNRGVTDSTYDYWIAKFCWEIPNATAILPEAGVNIYPNPFTTDLSIYIQKENLREAFFTITNLQGQTVFSRHETGIVDRYIKMLDLSYLAKGVYIVEVVTGGERVVRKVVKE